MFCHQVINLLESSFADVFKWKDDAFVVWIEVNTAFVTIIHHHMVVFTKSLFTVEFTISIDFFIHNSDY